MSLANVERREQDGGRDAVEREIVRRTRGERMKETRKQRRKRDGKRRRTHEK